MYYIILNLYNLMTQSQKAIAVLEHMPSVQQTMTIRPKA
jgi:hypothetical protein